MLVSVIVGAPWNALVYLANQRVATLCERKLSRISVVVIGNLVVQLFANVVTFFRDSPRLQCRMECSSGLNFHYSFATASAQP